jgi:hypothetical protein
MKDILRRKANQIDLLLDILQRKTTSGVSAFEGCPENKHRIRCICFFLVGFRSTHHTQDCTRLLSQSQQRMGWDDAWCFVSPNEPAP